MTATLIISNGSAQNPLTLDLSKYLRLMDGEGMDPQDPSFREAVITHSLLKEGGTLALENLKAKELVYPLALNAPLAPVTNLVPDPSFDYDAIGAAPAGWTSSTFATEQVQAGWSSRGKQSLRLTSRSLASAAQDSIQVATGVTAGTVANAVAITAGQTLAVRADVNVLAVTGQMQCYIQVNWHNSSGVFISAATSSTHLTAAGIATQSDVFTAPANTAGARVLYIAISTQTSSTADLYIDSVMAVLQGSASTYVDGDQLGCSWNGPPGNSTSTAPGGLSQSATMVQQLNQAVSTPGVTFSWQDTGLSQPTVFDGITGQFDVEYSYREHEHFWVKGKLRLFAQPFGRTAAPRLYATASGVGPLLMISPYASGGGNALGASTQAGVAGYGGQQQGASSGVFYWGNPDLAGDAPAQLQISYVGPLPNTATNTGVVPYTAVSLLPDQNYNPLITAPQISFANLNSSTSRRNTQTSVASSYVQLTTGASLSVQDMYSFSPVSGAIVPPVGWAGQHRVLAIARASSANVGGLAATLAVEGGPLTQPGQVVRVANQLDWALYDLGTLALRASQLPGTPVQINAQLIAGASAALDLAALVMLPDATTWFLNPTAVQPSQYGYPPNLASTWGQANAPWTNTFLMDDVIGDQFIYYGQSQTFAPSPLGSVPSSAPITRFSRGLIPRPDPKSGPPIIAIVGVGQNTDSVLQGISTLVSESFGPNGAGVVTTDAAVGSIAWFPTNAATLQSAVAARDGAYAQAGTGAPSHTNYLKGTSLGFAVPSAATITGIRLDVWRRSLDGTANDDHIRLMKAGVAAGTDKSAGAAWPLAFTQATFGGSTDLWGTTWTPSDINNSGFGYGIASLVTDDAEVDFVAITVSFTLGQSASFLGASQANPQNLRTMAQVNVLERARYILS